MLSLDIHLQLYRQLWHFQLSINFALMFIKQLWQHSVHIQITLRPADCKRVPNKGTVCDICVCFFLIFMWQDSDNLKCLHDLCVAKNNRMTNRIFSERANVDLFLTPVQEVLPIKTACHDTIAEAWPLVKLFSTTILVLIPLRLLLDHWIMYDAYFRVNCVYFTRQLRCSRKLKFVTYVSNTKSETFRSSEAK